MPSTINADNGVSSGSAGLKSTADSSGVLSLQTNGTTAVTVDTSQNVGVGTTSPGTKLNVYTGSATNTIVRVANTAGSIDFGVLSTGEAYGGYGNNTVYFGTSSASPAVFYTNATERMRIDSSGNLLVGKTSSAVTTVGSAITPKSFQAVANDGTSGFFYNQTSGTTGYAALWRVNNVDAGSITVSGTTTSYVTSSDYRLKENVQPMTGALAKVAALKPCTYTWKSNGSVGEGFIAHELAEVCPQAVSGEKDAVNEDGSIKPQGIDTSFLVATLTAAIQELNAKVQALESQLAAKG